MRRGFIALILLLLAGCAPAALTTLEAPPAAPLEAAPSAIPQSDFLLITPTSDAAPQPTRAVALPAIYGAASASQPSRPAAPTAAPGEGIDAREPADAALEACRQAGGRWLKDFIVVESLKQPLAYKVYLPPCYDEEPQRRYPALYLVHGQSFTYEQWDELGVDETADQLIASGELPPFLIILPWDRVWTQPEQDPFGQAVIERLVPEIDAAFRTQPEASQRAVGGLSRGGGWAIHLGLSRPDLFGALGAHSPALFHSDAPRLRHWLSATPPAQRPRIYIDIGEDDNLLASAQSLADLLVELEVPHTWRLNPGDHEEEYWRAHVEDYLRWYAEAWR